MPEQKYKTNQRKLIMEYLQESAGKHITADDLLFALKERGCPVGRATVYRFFDTLAKEGVLFKYPSVDGASACYEYRGGGAACSGHYHLKCGKCGALFHLECEDVAKLYAHIRESHGFEVDNRTTVFYGTCNSCAEKERLEEKE